MIFDFAKNHKGCWVLMLLSLLLGSLPGLVQAQDEVRYDVVLQGVPLDDALRQLLTKTDLKLAFEQSLVEGKRVYLTHDGQEVWSKMNASVLRDMALATGGAYVPLGTGTVDMGRIYAERIEPMASREFEATTVKRHYPRYQWFAGLALLLLVTEALTGDRKAPPRGTRREARP